MNTFPLQVNKTHTQAQLIPKLRTTPINMFHGSLSSAEVILPPGGIFLQCGKSCVFHVFEVEQRTIDCSDSPSFTVWNGFHLCVRYLLPPPPPLPLLFIPDSETDMIKQPSDRKRAHTQTRTNSTATHDEVKGSTDQVRQVCLTMNSCSSSTSRSSRRWAAGNFG